MYSFADIIIIGGGIAGCALLHELAKTNSGRVVLLERGHLASETTGRSGGFIRKIHSDSVLRKMMSDSFDYYLSFNQYTGKSCGFINTGFIYRKPLPLTAEFQAHLDDLSKHEYRITILPSAEEIMIHEHAAGCIDTAMTCRAWVNDAKANHGIAYENVTVENILINNGQVIGVATDKGVIHSSHVIVAAGAWSGKLLASAGIELPLIVESFQNNVYQSAAHHLGGAYIDEVNKFYIFPLRNGDAVAGMLQDVNADEARQLHILVKKAFPQLNDDYKIHVNHDAFTEDGLGVAIDFVAVAGLYALTGLSAGGIKIMPALAKKMTNIILSDIG